jgi:hypothetical protein
VPVPFPTPEEVNLRPPDAAEVAGVCRGILGVIAPDRPPSELQRLLAEAIVPALTSFPFETGAPPVEPAVFARAMADRNEAFRTRIIQIIILLVLVLRPIPAEVVDRITRLAGECGIDEGMVVVAQEFAAGSLGLASMDFERNGYTAAWSETDQRALHTSSHLADAWESVVNDPALARRWQGLEDLAPGTLGRSVADFYRARGFDYPGAPGSAPPLLAQHDWVHVLADYGTTVECELEVFAFIARANDDMRAFSLLAMVVSLFETGYLRHGAGLFESDVGHLSRTGVATRLADAMRRGAQCTGSIDFLGLDWFALADLPIGECRDRLGVGRKAPGAVEHGSVGPWEPGGISPFQWAAGQAMALRSGRPYDSFGASVIS